MKLFGSARATELMEAAGVDCSIASSKHNVAYLSGYWHMVNDNFYVLWVTSVTHKTFCGVPVRQIRRKELKLYEGTGYTPVAPYTGRVVHEPPYVMEDDTTILEPGMSVTLEPTVNYQADGDIFISLEDQFIVTEDGAEYLTKDAPLDLHV
jgi:Xaa-Pro aminopeptidase